MNIGLIDVDGHNFPSLPLMKIASWHVSQGDSVSWYDPWAADHLHPYDKVYLSKVFSFTPDYPLEVKAKEIVRGGSGYCIELEDGIEVYHSERDRPLPYEVEHSYPAYWLYGITDTAYGFLSRGCPRQCSFCHVKSKEGTVSRKVADLSEFWRGQPNICLSDPNILACPDWRDLFGQLEESKAKVDFNQGLDVRLASEEKIEAINRLQLGKYLHMAWDNPRTDLSEDFKRFKKFYRKSVHNVSVYVLVNFDSTIEEDLYRIYTLRDLGYAPFVMIYDKEHADQEHLDLGRYVNNRFVFKAVPRFEDYKSRKET